MRILNTIQDLWLYCLLCPICKNKRDIDLLVGPDENFRLISFDKLDDKLILKCYFTSRRQKFTIDYTIDCINNDFELVFGKPKEVDQSATGASAPYFYFYINSECKMCDATWTNSSDLELDILNKKITNIGLERESVRCLTHNRKYQIELDYENNLLIINNVNRGVAVMPAFNFPLIDLDLTNQEKLFRKISTILTFS